MSERVTFINPLLKYGLLLGFKEPRYDLSKSRSNMMFTVIHKEGIHSAKQDANLKPVLCFYFSFSYQTDFPNSMVQGTTP